MARLFALGHFGGPSLELFFSVRNLAINGGVAGHRLLLGGSGAGFAIGGQLGLVSFELLESFSDFHQVVLDLLDSSLNSGGDFLNLEHVLASHHYGLGLLHHVEGVELALRVLLNVLSFTREAFGGLKHRGALLLNAVDKSFDVVLECIVDGGRNVGDVGGVNPNEGSAVLPVQL